MNQQVELRFDHLARQARTHTNLSALRREGDGLWVAGDETATVEYLTWSGERYDHQRSFRLADYVDLPAGPDEEADIEGLARSGGYLWLVGSHSLKRKRVKSPDPNKARRRLSTVLREENRFILVRLPLDPATNAPARTVDGRTAAILSGPGRNVADLVAEDPHLAPFLALPGKDNGFDLEGIAMVGDRIFLGLRGPVLRGWAVVLEIRTETDPRDPHRLRVAAPYQTYFLDLDGLGVRDLCPDGEDLLLLAGPTMHLDGPVRVVRWRAPGSRSVVPAVELEPVTDLPFGAGCDHPEGLAVLEDGRLMVVYDSPGPHRLTPEGGVYADVITI